MGRDEMDADPAVRLGVNVGLNNSGAKTACDRDYGVAGLAPGRATDSSRTS